jgi:GNAT superfamily N-acetyltransferase
MSAILTDLAPLSLAAAIKGNLYAFFQNLRLSPLAVVHETAGAFRWHTAVAHPWFNGILCTLPPGEQSAELADETIAFFQSRAVGSFTWWLAPHLDAEPWRAQLSPLGFRYDDQTPGMAIDLAALPPLDAGELTMQILEEPHELAAWTTTFARGYGIPKTMGPPLLSLLGSLGTSLPFRHYLGLRGGQPVATATLFCGAGVAGIYNVATLPEARGRGIGAAITLAPLYAAREMGYRAGILQSSDMGYSVYERLGFQRRCQIEHFYWSGRGAQTGDP